jgi:hypothetical protein
MEEAMDDMVGADQFAHRLQYLVSVYVKLSPCACDAQFAAGNPQQPRRIF